SPMPARMAKQTIELITMRPMKRIYAAASWGGVSLAARFSGMGHALMGIPSSRSSFCAKAKDGVLPPASSW
ncbi:hypothetical protein, partial [Brevundimonas sp.]|uniref:hypothetical protein n=1 Tax=Brevundimonas sp. TaxID=1871086 RepID=UPI0025C02521